MMPGGYLQGALYGVHMGTVTVDGPLLSNRDRQRFFESTAAFEETTGTTSPRQRQSKKQ